MKRFLVSGLSTSRVKAAASHAALTSVGASSTMSINLPKQTSPGGGRGSQSQAITVQRWYYSTGSSGDKAGEKTLNEQMHALFQHFSDKVNAGFDKVDAGLEKVKKELVSLNKRMEKIVLSLDCQMEEELRQEVAKHYGLSYSQQNTADCILNLVAMLPMEMLNPGTDKYTWIIETAEAIGRMLLESESADTNNRVNRFLRRMLEVLGQPILESEELPDIETWGRILGSNSLLEKVKLYYENKEESKGEKQIKDLVRCRGLGLPLAIYESQLEIGAAGTMFDKHDYLDFDLQGAIRLYETEVSGNKLSIVGSIEVGACKSSLEDIETSSKQLGLRLNVLEWLIKAVAQSQGKEVGELSKIGRLFVPKSSIKEEDVQECQNWDILETHNAILRIHRF